MGHSVCPCANPCSDCNPLDPEQVLRRMPTHARCTLLCVWLIRPAPRAVLNGRDKAEVTRQVMQEAVKGLTERDDDEWRRVDAKVGREGEGGKGSGAAHESCACVAPPRCW